MYKPFRFPCSRNSLTLPDLPAGLSTTHDDGDGGRAR